ncbi:hypothetical protein TVAG_355690 [Trichomonas vaginalis G3]|uniref:Uncharacterized protein n=1 Tax=Trichomonas vaginalis (strain ATCC PRA-98 / G3) TaxID=412133 RepID=A2FJU2_TRIV3|nr:hypothetical protein TVAGG3_0364420 [Trichomonas vaginalis G3]EAX94833.1 hypothetical protein TVAG_355690 [Trichomonas vaginalis G3]KAI5532173.1 hypothetical protein TVAGG3_0364420 [Trichomonas vaginalis G3]|eukprot:XP_001307763.1 hypothetical protein [Trichomonas vaginalis G3]
MIFNRNYSRTRQSSKNIKQTNDNDLPITNGLMAKLKCYYFYDIWKEFYQEFDNSVIEINESGGIAYNINAKILVYNVLFQDNFDNSIIYIKSNDFKFLISNSIFDSISLTGSDNSCICQDGGSCVQHQICVKNISSNHFSKIEVSTYDNNINYFIDSSIIDIEVQEYAISQNNGNELIDKSNISNAFGGIEILNQPKNSKVSYSSFMNNRAYNIAYLLYFETFNGNFHHLIIDSNNAYTAIIFLYGDDQFVISSCNIINNYANYLIELYRNVIISNCFIDRNNGEIVYDNYQLIEPADKQIDLKNSNAGDDLCNGDSFIFNKILFKNISVRNLNYPIIEYNENIQLEISAFGTSTKIEIVTWIDADETNFIPHDLQPIIEHNLEGVFGKHILNIKFESNGNYILKSFEFTRRNEAIINIMDLIYTGNKVAITGTVDKTFNDCFICLSFDNKTCSKNFPIFSNEFDIVSNIPDNSYFKSSSIFIHVRNKNDKILGSTHQKLSKINSTNNCFPVYSLRRKH